MHSSPLMLHEIGRGLREVLPESGHKHLLRFLPLAVLGAVLSLSCHLDRIAVELVFAGGVGTMLQRLRRWIMRDTFVVHEVLTGWVRQWVRGLPDPLLLIVDRTDWKHANLFYAAVPFRGRAVPVALIALPGPKAANHQELALLLERAAQAIAPERTVIVLGDREFGNVPMIEVIRQRGWHFCLRFKQDTWLYAADGTAWQARDRWPSPGGRILASGLQVTLRQYGPLEVATVWQPGEDEPWTLVSDSPASQLAPLYRRRMGIEAVFSDLKTRGFNLEASRLRHVDRLERLAGLLSLAYFWLVLTAHTIVRRGLRRQVNVARRRSLSYAQIAYRFLRGAPPQLTHSVSAAVARALEPK
jgi:hypothetical protein